MQRPTRSGQCTSACVLLYANAERHFAPFNSYFGFHYKTWSRVLFEFGRVTGGYQHVYPMTDEMDRLSQGIRGHARDLSVFFNSCSRENPTHSQKAVYLSSKQITDIVQGRASPVCDDIVGQDLNWYGSQVTAAYTVARWLRF